MNEEQKKAWGELSKGKIWTAAVIPDPDNAEQCILVLPEDLVDTVEWKDGDVLVCSVLPEGRIILSKS